MLLRKNLLRRYVERLEEICYIELGKPVFSEAYDHVKYPLSDDGHLHYEILFREDCICVCIHFEGEWRKKRTVIKSDLLMHRNLKINEDWLGFFYRCHDYDELHIAAILNHLIVITYPILLSCRMISKG